MSNTLARIRNVQTFESKTFPREPHGFRVAANRIELYRRLEAFLDRYLKQ